MTFFHYSFIAMRSFDLTQGPLHDTLPGLSTFWNQNEIFWESQKCLPNGQTLFPDFLREPKMPTKWPNPHWRGCWRSDPSKEWGVWGPFPNKISFFTPPGKLSGDIWAQIVEMLEIWKQIRECHMENFLLAFYLLSLLRLAGPDTTLWAY